MFSRLMLFYFVEYGIWKFKFEIRLRRGREKGRKKKKEEEWLFVKHRCKGYFYHRLFQN